MLYFAAIIITTLLALLLIWRKIDSQPRIKTNLEQIHRVVRQRFAVCDWESARRDLSGLAHLEDADETTLVLYARSLRGCKRYEDAESCLAKLLERNPAHMEAIKEHGKLLLEQGKPQEALQKLNQSVSSIRDEESLIDLSAALFANGDVEAAWKHVEQHALQSSNGRLLSLAADCQFYWKNYTLAIQLYQQAEHYGWSNYRTISRTGQSLCCVGSFLEAENHFRELLNYDPEDCFTRLALGFCLEKQELFEQALDVYQQCKTWDQNHPHLLRQAGICAAYMGEFAHAEFYLKSAIRQNVVSPRTYACLGYSLECQKRWDEAEEVYLDFIERYPEHVAGFRALARLFGIGLSRKITPQDGIAFAQFAVQLLPDSASWEILSACEARMGNFSRAHHIQEHLWTQAPDKETRERCHKAMRALRKCQPLDEQHVGHVLVA